MYRIAIEKLLKWKQSKRRKPLIIEGARQVGKTYTLRRFGKEQFRNVVYVNLEANQTVASFFDADIIPTISSTTLIFGKSTYPSSSASG